MVIFAIPLRTKETLKDRNGCVRRLNQTDDLIHQRIAEYCEKQPNKNGLVPGIVPVSLSVYDHINKGLDFVL